MRNHNTLTVKMEVRNRFAGFLAFFALITFFVTGLGSSLQAQSLKALQSKNVESSISTNDWAKGLVKISGYENGFETDRFLDPEFYDSNGEPKVDFSKMKNSSSVLSEMRLTSSGCQCSFNLTANWDFNGGTSNGIPNNWTPSNGNFALFSNSQTGNYGILNNGDNNGNYYVTQVVDAPYAAGQEISMDAFAATHNVSGTAQLYFEFLDASNSLLGTSTKRTVTNSYNDNGTPLDAINTITNTAPANTVKIRIVGYSNKRALKFDSVKLTYCSSLKLENPDPSTAQVNKNQVFDLTLTTSAPNGTKVEWVRSTQNVSSLSQLTNKTYVGEATASSGEAKLQITAPSSAGTYYYYANFKPQDPCGSFVKYVITVKDIGTNDPVCLSGTRALTDNLLRGACQTSSTYYSVWLDLKSSQNKPNYQHFKTTDLKFEEYCNGTAKIYGRAKANGGGSNDYIDIVYDLSDRTATTPSNSPKANSCTTYGNDLYYYKTAVGTIKGGSNGIYSGMEISISDNDSNTMPAFQLGTGANVNTNNFGASGWFDLNFTSSGTNGWSKKTSHGDFNFNLGGIIPFELEASASAQSVCLEGSVTFNAQFKGEVPDDCNLSYSWKSPDNVQVSTTQSFTINNVTENHAGVYTVTASFISGGKVCNATATVNIIVDANCEGTPVCVPDCTPVALASWDLDNCNTGTGGNWYGEFTAKTNTGGCGEIEASTIYRVNPDVNKHSCASGISGDAMCINGINSTSKPGSGNDRAVRFATTITPSNGKSYKLSDLQFSYKRSGYQCNDGGSQSLVLYVFKNGTKVHEETITGLTKSWKTKTVTFAETEDFISDAATTYEFELIGFNPVGGCTVWEIDEVKLNGCCGNSVAKPIINVSNANICKGESVILTASNCSGSLLWSTGATTEQITVSPQTTTTYLVSCSLGSCSAEQSVKVTVDPNCNNNVCLTCNPLTVVKWNLNECQALSGAYTYSEFLPDYPNSGNFSSVSATNVYRENPNDNYHSCVVGFTGQANSDRAMCVSSNKGSSADWGKAVKFSATFNPSQTGDITALRFNQRATPTLNYSPEPASSGGSANNNYPTKYSVRIYKGSTLVFESLNRPTNPTNWTTENIDLSSDPDFEFTSNTTYKFELTAFAPVGNGASLSVWDLDNIEIVACNKSEELTVSAANNSPLCTGADVTLTASSSSSNLTYNWTGPVGFVAQAGASVTTTISGVYTVTATASNSCTATATTIVTDNPCGSIGSTVWADDNNNGIIDPTENGLAGVTVSLYDGNNILLETDDTDINGNYFFGNLVPGTYQVKILGSDLPTDYQYVSDVTIDTEEVDGNNNGTQAASGQDIVSQIVTLEVNGEPTGSAELLGNSDNQTGGTQDDTKDSYGDMTVDFGLILNPKLEINKTFVSATDLGNNQFEVLYEIVVDNSGVAKTTYGLSDLPAFDNDINILEASYTSDAPGFSGTSLAGNGPWSLSTDVLLGGGLEHTYVLKVKAAINLTDGVSGDDTYKECGSGNSSTIAAGEGLFNVASLLDGSELVIDKDSACGDLPFITHSKTLTSTTPLGDNKYQIVYDIVVNNVGGAAGTYGLKDDASFEDDINILDVSYTTTSGVPTVSLYPTDAVWTLATGVSLGAGASHSYTVKVVTQIDMTSGSGGNNVYEACGSKVGGTEFEAGEGLFNESLLTDFNGAVIEKDTACGDLPYVVHSKVASNRTQIDRDDYS